MKRRAMYAGSWYPEDAMELEKLVRTDGKGKAAAAVLPHSGLYFSSPAISSFFTSLSPEIRKILVISPSHYYPLSPSEFITSSFSLSETPFGDVSTFRFPIEARMNDRAIEKEHGIEMFLPFIRKKNLSVSYALISSFRSIDDIEYYASLLSSSLTEDTAVIASSDFTHYGLRFGYCPYEDDALRRVSEFDLKAAGEMIEGNLEKLFLLQKRSTICGIAAGMLLSLMMKSMGKKGYVRDHYTSYDILRDDPEDFVSYVGIIWE